MLRPNLTLIHFQKINSNIINDYEYNLISIDFSLSIIMKY